MNSLWNILLKLINIYILTQEKRLRIVQIPCKRNLRPKITTFWCNINSFPNRVVISKDKYFTCKDDIRYWQFLLSPCLSKTKNKISTIIIESWVHLYFWKTFIAKLTVDDLQLSDIHVTMIIDSNFLEFTMDCTSSFAADYLLNIYYSSRTLIARWKEKNIIRAVEFMWRKAYLILCYLFGY